MQNADRNRGGARILVADDSKDALSAYEAYLQFNGYEVTVSPTGDGALRQARETLPAVVIVDHEMPGLTGCEVAKALGSEAETRNIPVIMVTGRDDPETRQRAMFAGCVAFLTKPCKPALLLMNLALALSRAPATG
jgi:CheY-like chemotaxis protein